jgi:hypothetical protein
MEGAGLTPSLEKEAFSAPGLSGSYWQGPVTDQIIQPNMVMFTSYATLKDNVASLPSTVTWVALDLERWDQTPLWQQRNPAHAEQLAWQVAQAYGKKLINTPAVSLLSSMGYKVTQANYLKAKLAYYASKYGNAAEIQAQRYDQAPTSYAAFVKQASAQALAGAKAGSHPANILAGLSTCAANAPISAQQLDADYSQTNVWGWWLNVPTWPACPDGNPSSAIGFLENVYGVPAS